MTADWYLYLNPVKSENFLENIGFVESLEQFQLEDSTIRTPCTQRQIYDFRKNEFSDFANFALYTWRSRVSILHLNFSSVSTDFENSRMHILVEASKLLSYTILRPERHAHNVHFH